MLFSFPSIETILYNDYSLSEHSDLKEGEEFRFTLLYQIPKDATIVSIQVGNSFSDKNIDLLKDDSLIDGLT